MPRLVATATTDEVQVDQFQNVTASGTVHLIHEDSVIELRELPVAHTGTVHGAERIKEAACPGFLIG